MSEYVDTKLINCNRLASVESRTGNDSNPAVFTNPLNEKLKDLNRREVSALVPLVFLVIFLGVYPKPILEPVDNSVKQLVQVMYLKSVEPASKAKIASINSIGEMNK